MRVPYDFSALLPADFEGFARELVGKALGIRFEAFGPGPDGGIDGRHASGESDVILQVKHYAGSPFPQLAAAMRKERASIDRLVPGRYLLATSRHLSPPNKAERAPAIGPSLLGEADIFDDLGRARLRDAVRRRLAERLIDPKAEPEMVPVSS